MLQVSNHGPPAAIERVRANGPRRARSLRDRQRRTLDDRPGVRPRRGERGLEPARGGLAVVVGERDPPPARGPPAQIAGAGRSAAAGAQRASGRGRRPRARSPPPSASSAPSSTTTTSNGSASVCARRLASRRGEALGPVAGGDHDADRRRGHAGTGRAAGRGRGAGATGRERGDREDRQQGLERRPVAGRAGDREHDRGGERHRQQRDHQRPPSPQAPEPDQRRDQQHVVDRDPGDRHGLRAPLGRPPRRPHSAGRRTSQKRDSPFQ